MQKIVGYGELKRKLRCMAITLLLKGLFETVVQGLLCMEKEWWCIVTINECFPRIGCSRGLKYASSALEGGRVGGCRWVTSRTKTSFDVEWK